MIEIKTKEEIKVMREGGKILAEILEKLILACQPGVSALDLDKLAEKEVLKTGALPSFKGYQNYPASICVSLNEEIVHGLPSKNKILKNGDIVTLDLGVKYKGFHTDAAKTIALGKISKEDQRLIQTAKLALKRAISQIREGVHLGKISNTIENVVRSAGFQVVRELSGHGIGKTLQENPPILNFGKANFGPILKKGMVLAIEPMVAVGTWKIKTLVDGWTVVTLDGKKSAHFEDTVLVLKEGCEVLTD